MADPTRSIQQMDKQDPRDPRKPDHGALSSYVMGIFSEFKNARKPFEEMWIECWYNYLGQYQKNTTWGTQTEGESGRSRIFIKSTTVKCNTAHAKVMDMAFSKDGGESVPFACDPILLPIHEKMGITEVMLKEATKGMYDRIRNHHKEIDLIEHIDTGVLEMGILGTAVLKGPTLLPGIQRSYSVRTAFGLPINHFDENLSPYQRQDVPVYRPHFIHIPLWEYYCDPNAKKSRESIMEMQFQRLLPGEFAALTMTGGFDPEAVAAAKASATDNATSEENTRPIQMGDNYMGESGEKDKRISVLEAWGWVPVRALRDKLGDAGATQVPAKLGDDDYVEAAVWLAADGIVIKAAVNTLNRRPFNVCPWKKVPHQIYGHGVAWAMRDSQKMINSSMRMIIDNKALTGPGMIAVNKGRLDTKLTRDMKIYPWKVWHIKGNFAPKDVIDSVKFTDVTRELRELRQDFERFADEETSLPKLEEGQQASFLNKTAAGMSMLMGRTNVNVKPTIKNIDDFWIEPIVESEYDWFMDMEPDPSIKVPIKPRATGIATLIANELKMENYAKFLQITGANPQDAIFVDRPKAIENYARMLDTEDIMRPKDEAMRIIEEMQRQAGAGKDIKEYIAIDKIFPLLTPPEQDQIIQMFGVTPDSKGRGVIAALNVEKLQAEISKVKSGADKDALKGEIDRLKTDMNERDLVHQIERQKADAKIQEILARAEKALLQKEKSFEMKKTSDGYQGKIK